MGASLDLFSAGEQSEAEEQPNVEAQATSSTAVPSSSSSEALKGRSAWETSQRGRRRPFGISATGFSTSPEAVKLPPPGAGKSGKLQKPAEWSSRQLPHRLFCVVRHSERADALGALFTGKPWTLTEEFRVYPTDPPLSDAGRQQAEHIGQQVREFADRWSERPANMDSGSCPPAQGIHVVVCSPYLRCVETAIQVCRQLGPQCKLIVDNSLAEVYGTCILGENEPVRRLQPFWRVTALARGAGIRCAAKPCGVFPSWPESLKGARLRYAATFFNYLQRAESAKRNFVLVSHADCLATVLALMPSKAGHLIDSVSYGATVFAYRPGTDARLQGPVGQAMSDLRSRLSPDLQSESQTGDGSSESCTSEGSKEGPTKTSSKKTALQISSWEVETTGLTMGPQWRDGIAASRAVKAALQTELRLRNSGQLSEKTMDALLGGLSQEPLGEYTPYKSSENCFGDGAELHGAMDTMDPDAASSCSSSTYMFGASDNSVESGLTPHSACAGQAGARCSPHDERPLFSRSLSENGGQDAKKHAKAANKLAKADRLSGLSEDRLRRKTAPMPSHREHEDHVSSNLFRPLADTGELHHGKQDTCNAGTSPSRRQNAENVQLQGCAGSAIMARRKGKATLQL